MKKFVVWGLVCLVMYLSYGSKSFANPSGITLEDRTTQAKPEQVFFLEDRQGILSIDEVASLYRDHQFQLSPSGVPSFGYTSAVYWLSFTVKNQSSKDDWLLETGSPPLDYLSLYMPKPSGGFVERQMGDLYPFWQREVQARDFVLDVKLNPGEAKTYYIRVKTEGAMRIPLVIWEKSAYHSHAEKQTAIHFLYYGIILVMTIYNFFLFLFLRNKSYLFYSLFSLSYMFIPMTNLGDAYQWLWPGAPWWNNRSIVFFIAVSGVLSALFVKNFLNIKETLPRIHSILNVYILLQIVTVGILLLWSYPIALNLIFITSVLHGPLFLCIGIASWRKKHPLAQYYVIAWVLFLVANSISMLNDIGVIRDSVMTNYILFIGSATELVLFSLGLSAQVDRIRREKEQLALEIEETQREIVFTMGEVIEARCKETSNHVKRVAEYSVILAEGIGIPATQVERLKIASPMHDIGKVGIPDAILLKPGKLTPEEFDVIKTHTEIGYDLLRHSSRDILQLAAIIAHEHHEKYDGTGYPKGLKGDEINIFARITAIADVFDALGSDRPYKKAWELDRILTLIDEEKGKHFDPELVEVFFENFNKILFVKGLYPD